MEYETAFILRKPSDEVKNKLQLLGSSYVPNLKGYVLTKDMKEKLEKNDIPVPTIANGIFITEVDAGWSVTGKTFDKKEKIKQLGGKWNNFDKSWIFPKNRISKEKLQVELA